MGQWVSSAPTLADGQSWSSLPSYSGNVISGASNYFTFQCVAKVGRTSDNHVAVQVTNRVKNGTSSGATSQTFWFWVDADESIQEFSCSCPSTASFTETTRWYVYDPTGSSIAAYCGKHFGTQDLESGYSGIPIPAQAASLRVYSGSSFSIPTSVKEYNGSAFTTVSGVYAYTGGQWKGGQ